MTVTEQRSGMASDNWQETLDAESNTGFSQGKAEQYFTPQSLVDYCQSKLLSYAYGTVSVPQTLLDPQVGQGALINRLGAFGCYKFGIEMDNRIKLIEGVQLITANCVKVFEAIDDLYPSLRFQCINANPPFGRRWKLKDGRLVDSTEYTWLQATRRGNYGYFISNAKTIEALGLNKHRYVYAYEVKEGSDIWPGMKAELRIGILWWKRPENDYTEKSTVWEAWKKINEVIEQEKVTRPDFNIYLDQRGYLRTYLSIRDEYKQRVNKEMVLRLNKINDSHPLTLTTEKETRDLMTDLVNCGVYTVQPEARDAIERALEECKALAIPIMPVTNFETVAYADEEEKLLCMADARGRFNLTEGRSYKITTGSYKFSDQFKRNKIHYNEETGSMYELVHDCELSGSDRYIEITDDARRVCRFMDRPNPKMGNQFEETLLWKHFKPPVVKTVAEVHPDIVARNRAIMKACEMIAGFTYYDGQIEYLSRFVRDYGLVAAETGTGKTLFALSLLTIKSPHRALIIAPQGVIKSSESEDDEDGEEFDASQWLQEIQRFAPHLQVFQIFSRDDYESLIKKYGELPTGVYVSYYEAMFSNGAMEGLPDSWDDKKLNQWARTNRLAELELMSAEVHGREAKKWHCNSVGQERNGIRCIIKPCLATDIGHLFDCVMLDEAHRVTNLGARVTQMLIRLQPKFRFAFTATPIPNIVSNLFSLLGWLAVPGWYKRGIRNAAFPYAREELGRFNSTFLSMERDFTQEDMLRAKAARTGDQFSGKCIKASPVISAPARLLKLIKPVMAFVSKEMCNTAYIPPKITDVRVPLGVEQAQLYKHFLDRGNIPGDNALVRAIKQIAYLRAICTDPLGFRHHTQSSSQLRVRSNLNPKVIAILELVRDIIARGEQVVVINSRVGITDTIQEKLNDAGVGTARIDSTVLAEKQSHQANLFKDKKAPVMLMGIKCAAANSFDQCENLIIGSLEFAPGPFNQAKGRIDRVTNKIIKNIYVILNRLSYDDVMFDMVATKDDSATICLRGQRVPRNFKPVDASEIMVEAVKRFSMDGSVPEFQCEQQWPELRDQIRRAQGLL